MTLAHPGCYGDMNKDRFEAFSDGVFAFALTLLILGIALPGAHYATERELRTVLPVLSFAAYVFQVLYFLVPRGVDADLE
jgi:uncharacterized membrane protein